MQNSGKRITQALVFFCIILCITLVYGKPIPITYFAAGFLISVVLRFLQVMVNPFENKLFLRDTALSLVIWTMYWLLSTALVNFISDT